MPSEDVIYDLEWDTKKARANFRKHRVSFEEAGTVFLDPKALSVYDLEHSDVEDRWITLGLSSSGRLLVVCHTFKQAGRRRALVRLISSRKAIKKEAQAYGE